MFRRLFRAVRHTLGAAILVIGSVCLIEVVISARHASRVADHQAETVDDLTLPSATAFQELRPLARVMTETSVVEVNSFGLRGPEPAVPKPPDVYRILVLGDDATLAAGAAFESTFCVQLQQMLAERTAHTVEVINAGQPGGCPLTLALLYRHRLAALSPDAVVLAMSASQVTNDLRARPFLLTDADQQPLACPHPSVGGREQPMDVWRNEFRLVDWAAERGVEHWLGRATQSRADLLSPSRSGEWVREPSGQWAHFLVSTLAPIEPLRRHVESRGGRFLLTVIPDATALDGPQPGWQTVGQFATKSGIVWLDPAVRLPQVREPAAFFSPSENDLPGQISVYGHKLVAVELALHFATEPKLASAPAASPR